MAIEVNIDVEALQNKIYENLKRFDDETAYTEDGMEREVKIVNPDDDSLRVDVEWPSTWRRKHTEIWDFESGFKWNRLEDFQMKVSIWDVDFPERRKQLLKEFGEGSRDHESIAEDYVDLIDEVVGGVLETITDRKTMKEKFSGDDPFDIGFEYEKDEVESYSKPTDYSDEYKYVHDNPGYYHIYPDFDAQEKYDLPVGTVIVVQGPTDESTKVKTKVPFTLYFDPTTLFALDSAEHKLHFQTSPSPRILNDVSLGNGPERIEIGIDG